MTTTFKLKRRVGFRGLSIRVRESGEVVVIAPKTIPLKQIQKFFDSKKEWVDRAIKQTATFKRNKLGDGKHMYNYKARAQKFLVEKVKFFNEHYKLPYNLISVRNQSTRWGSCSQNKTLSFSYKLLFLPEVLADYVVVHEICHLKEMNHSERFWKLVREQIPDYRSRRRELKKYTLI